MCGIVGWVNLESQNAQRDCAEALLREMCERLTHRGPDDEGVFLDNTVALGMRRLAIIDVLHGEQPAFNEDRTVAVILNGEIYNYRELRRELEKRGHRLASHSDTEVLPHLYEEYGEEMVKHLNGMFAFALWDSRRKKLLIARDRFGEKPLYYGVFDNKLIFASEPKAMLAHEGVKPALNLHALRHYLSFDYVPAPLSIYEDVKKLPAAYTLTVEEGKIKTERYWRLSFKKENTKQTIDEAAERLRELMADAVRIRLVSDVPLGVLLSGGVDSSAVAAFASRASSEPIKTFSISFSEPSFDESTYARRVSEHIGTQHHEHHLSVDLAANLVSEIGSWLDEPLSDPSILPTYLLSSFTRKHVTVALGGDGGDELFAGYPMYYAHNVAAFYERLPRFLKNHFIEPIVRQLPVNTENLSFDYKARRFVNGMKYDTVARHHSWFGSFTQDGQELLLSDDVKRQTDSDIYAAARLLLKDCDAENVTEQMQFLDTQFYLAEDILTKVDRASMAVSLEVRAPFLDYRVAEFAASLPVDFKQHGRVTKYVLKKATSSLLPSFVAKRGKKGFGVPIADWLKGKLKPLAKDMLSSERLKRGGLFNADYVQKLFKEHESGAANHRKLLWTLLMFELWRESFIETPKRIETIQPQETK